MQAHRGVAEGRHGAVAHEFRDARAHEHAAADIAARFISWGAAEAQGEERKGLAVARVREVQAEAIRIFAANLRRFFEVDRYYVAHAAVAALASAPAFVYLGYRFGDKGRYDLGLRFQPHITPAQPRVRASSAICSSNFETWFTATSFTRGDSICS